MVVGCNGYNADKVAARIRSFQSAGLTDLYMIARDEGFGCASCRVVIGREGVMCVDPDDLHDLYRETFDQPAFNPRWENGACECYEPVDVSGSA